MSQIVTTSEGWKFNRVNDGEGNDAWLFRCPGCGTWAYLDEDQWNGTVSVDHASMGCPGGYHETHPFGAALVAAIQARILTDQPPYDPDESAA